MPNLDDNEPEIVYGPDYEAKAIAKVARQIVSANDDDEQAAQFFTQTIQALALLDQIAPQFIELVDEYHIGENPQATDCRLCQLRTAAQEYLDKKQ